MSAKWDYDKRDRMSCGEHYYECYFIREDDWKKEWSLAETAERLTFLEAEVERLRGDFWIVGISMRDVEAKTAYEFPESLMRAVDANAAALAGKAPYDPA